MHSARTLIFPQVSVTLHQVSILFKNFTRFYINECIVANKAVVIVRGLASEYQRQYGTIDLYWIVRDGGLMLLLSQPLLTKESFESCKIQVFCIAEEDSDAKALKADVKKFLYDFRMQAEVIVITMKSWDLQLEGEGQQDESLEAFTAARRRIANYLTDINTTAEKNRTPLMADGKNVIVNEQQVEKFLYTTLKLNSTILRYSRMAAVVLVSLPPPPASQPSGILLHGVYGLVSGKCIKDADCKRIP
ncbi:hypothetical protein SLE2022_039020 [Rubroshorea leprosula]